MEVFPQSMGLQRRVCRVKRPNFYTKIIWELSVEVNAPFL
jgi:hypothetical protein